MTSTRLGRTVGTSRFFSHCAVVTERSSEPLDQDKSSESLYRHIQLSTAEVAYVSPLTPVFHPASSAPKFISMYMLAGASKTQEVSSCPFHLPLSLQAIEQRYSEIVIWFWSACKMTRTVPVEDKEFRWNCECGANPSVCSWLGTFS